TRIARAWRALSAASGLAGQAENMRHADDPDQAAEDFHAALTQVYFAVHIGEHLIDRAIVSLGDARQNLPIHLLKTQAGGKTIETHGFGQRPGELHIEAVNKGIHGGTTATDPCFFSDFRFPSHKKL